MYCLKTNTRCLQLTFNTERFVKVICKRLFSSASRIISKEKADLEEDIYFCEEYLRESENIPSSYFSWLRAGEGAAESLLCIDVITIEEDVKASFCRNRITQ